MRERTAASEHFHFLWLAYSRNNAELRSHFVIKNLYSACRRVLIIHGEVSSISERTAPSEHFHFLSIALHTEYIAELR